MSKQDLRDYGLKLPQHKIVGSPAWVRKEPEELCPNCGAGVAVIKVRIEMAVLTEGVGTGTYDGCPACPWASPMLVVSDGAASRAH